MLLHAKVHNHSEIELGDLPVEISKVDLMRSTKKQQNKISVDEAVARFEMQYIDDALRKSGGKKTDAWKLLGLNDRFALLRKVSRIMRQYPWLLNNFPHVKMAFAKRDITKHKKRHRP